MAGNEVGTYYDEGKDIDLTIRAAHGTVDTKEALAALSFVTPTDHLVKLSSIASVVVESGKHEELLRKGGHYMKLYNMQFRDVQENPQKPSALRQWWQRIRPNNEEDTPTRGKWRAGAN